MEKLIIISAIVRFTYRNSLSKLVIPDLDAMPTRNGDGLLPEEVEVFEFTIREPESDMISVFKTRLDQCFSVRELSMVNLREISKLKQFAKILLEQRSLIKR